MDDHEFGFWDLDESEFTVCRNYGFGREHEFARKEAINKISGSRNRDKYTVVYPDLEDLVLTIRQNWRVENLESPYSEQNPRWLQSPESRVLVLYPEWPSRPYLSIPKEERLSRLGKFFPELNRTDDLDVWVSEIHRELRKSEKDNDLERKAFLHEQLAGVASLIQPNWRGPKCVRNIAIPSNVEGAPTVYRRDVVTAFRAWLVINFPELPDDKKRGRASERARVADDLNALAVYRLRRDGKKLSEIVDLVRFPGSSRDGSKSYSSVKKLDSPLNRLPGRLVRFYRRVVNDLEPLEPSNPLIPRKPPTAE